MVYLLKDKGLIAPWLFQDADEKSEAPKSRRKRVKRESILGPAVNKEVVHEAVGLKPSILTPKEIPKIRTNAPVLKV